MLTQEVKPRTFFSSRAWRGLGSPAHPLACKALIFAPSWNLRQQGSTLPRSLPAHSSNAVAGLAALHSRPRQQQPRRCGSVVVRAGRDLYSILGIPRNASKHLIKTMYRKLARRTHPDVCKEADAEERFKQICEAYEVLTDDQKRALYDSFGEEGLRRGAGMSTTRRERPAPSSPFSRKAASNSSSSSGAGGDSTAGTGRGNSGSSGRGRGSTGATRAPPRASPTPGADIRQELRVEASEAELGARRTINVTRFEPCFACLGRGRKKGNYCSRCSGLGWVVRGGPVPGAVEDCPMCGGGGTCDAACQACQGEGRVRHSQPISVQVPAGTPDGSWLRVPGAGDAGICGGKPGDLFLRIVVVK